jgi:hypothetical protein
MTTLLAIVAAFLTFRSDGASGLFIGIVLCAGVQSITKGLMNSAVRYWAAQGNPRPAEEIPNWLALINLISTVTSIGLSIWALVRAFT